MTKAKHGLSKDSFHPGPASYSSLVRLPDGHIGLLFEGGEKHRREWIRFARFSLSWLTQGPICLDPYRLSPPRQRQVLSVCLQTASMISG